MVTLILDLDNTIFPVKAIGEKLFAPLFKLMEKKEYDIDEQNLKAAKNEIMRKPFQKVAETYGFPQKLIEESIALLNDLTYNEPIDYFEEYNFVRQLPARRILLTAGFTKLQKSKVRALGIENDFEEVFIVDSEKTVENKKDFIEKIIDRYSLSKDNLIVVGDDPDSEIQAAVELGVTSFLLDTEGKYLGGSAAYTGRTLKDLEQIPAIKNIKNSLL